MDMDKDLAKAIIENLLLISSRPLTINAIKDVLKNEFDSISIRNILKGLTEEYSQKSFQVIEVAGGYQFSTRFEYAAWIKRFHTSQKSSVITKASLETLAIIAYKQPITRIEIDSIRGVASGGTIRTLLEKNLIRLAGKKKVLGRPMMYGTSRKFLEYFGLQGLSGLPALKEFTEKELGDALDDDEKAELQLKLPLNDTPAESNGHGGDSVSPPSGENDR